MTAEVRTYVLTFVALLVLLGATVGLAYVDLGVFNPFIALGIAIAKAVLILLFFMHLRHGPKQPRVFLAASVLWLMLLLGLTLLDFLARR